jgi:hypothetical protein
MQRNIGAPGAGSSGGARVSASDCPFISAKDNKDVASLVSLAKDVLAKQMFGAESNKQAIQVLEEALGQSPADPKGEINALLGKAHFAEGHYGDAAKHLKVAAQRDPSNADLKDLVGRAERNVATNVAKSTMAPQKFDGDALMLPPAMHIREPQDLKPIERTPQGLGARIGAAAKAIPGAILGAGIEGAIKVAGMVGTNDEVYTNWSRKPGLAGTMTLASMRHWLNGHTLQNSYEGELVGHQQPGQKRPEHTNYVRTATGAWNTNDPMEGAAGTEFQRQGLSKVSERKNRALDKSLPNPLDVSRLILAAKGEQKQVPFLNNLVMAWIQFMVHDWVSHGQNLSSETFKLELSKDDPRRQKYGQDFIEVRKSQPNPTRKDGKEIYLNEVTHWWDGSQIYGSDQATVDRLRTGPDGKFLPDGKLRLDEDGLLPINPETGVADTGFSRNWWPGLEMLHTLFARNHNSICDELKKSGETKGWSSDQVFEVARMINAAMMAKIHTVEWTPAVLPNKKLAQGMGANWWGLLETMTKPFGERKMHNSLDVNHPVLGGIAGGKTDNHGKPYGFSEEFVEVYRLHAGLPNEIEIRDPKTNEVKKTLGVDATRAAASRKTIKEVGLAAMFNSFTHQHMAGLVNNNYPKFMTEMSTDENSFVDLGAVDILRARERGVPQYNEFRRQLGLNPIKKFEDLGADAETTASLKKLYNNDVEKLDLLAGTLTEAVRPEYFGFGETLFQVFIQMATRRLESDPFYTEKFNEQYYTKKGMELIDQATMKSLILKHMPELKGTDLDKNVNNAFEPTGTTAKTNPEEHPLTAHAEKY